MQLWIILVVIILLLMVVFIYLKLGIVKKKETIPQEVKNNFDKKTVAVSDVQIYRDDVLDEGEFNSMSSNSKWEEKAHHYQNYKDIIVPKFTDVFYLRFKLFDSKGHARTLQSKPIYTYTLNENELRKKLNDQKEIEIYVDKNDWGNYYVDTNFLDEN